MPVSRTSPEVLRTEEARIQAFVLSELQAKENARVSMEKIFDAYDEWLSHRGFPETVLTVDSFGRLFPKTFQRRMISVNGRVHRAVLNYELRS